jgi:hypothetical protein
MEFGILVDAVLGMRRLAEEPQRLTPVAFNGRSSALLKGVTGEHVMILDGEALLSDSRLLVHEEKAA